MCVCVKRERGEGTPHTPVHIGTEYYADTMASLRGLGGCSMSVIVAREDVHRNDAEDGGGGKKEKPVPELYRESARETVIIERGRAEGRATSFFLPSLFLLMRRLVPPLHECACEGSGVTRCASGKNNNNKEDAEKK